MSAVGMDGSLAASSASLTALTVAVDGAREYGAEVKVFNLRELNLPMYSPEAEAAPRAAIELCDAVHAAQGLMWSSPLYHGNVSGAFKNAGRRAQQLDESNTCPSCIPEVSDRYRTRSALGALEIWSPNRRVRSTTPDSTLRVQAPAAFRIRWSRDNWQTIDETSSSPTPLGIEFVDIPAAPHQRAPIRFTLFWPTDGRWEGRDYEAAVEPRD